MYDILNLDQFPLDRPHSPEWHGLVDRCRQDLVEKGMFNLDGLLRPQIAAQVSKDTRPLFQTQAFLHQREHNIYFKQINDLPADHPALKKHQTSNRTICGDQIEGSPLLRLYEWPEFADFLAATMSIQSLYTMDDPLARVNVMSYGEGQALNWHFDRSEFTTTLLLQSPDAGGLFEYRTALRKDSDPNYDGVGALLGGRDPQVQSINPSAGTLNVFKGKNTAHRVTPVQGETDRIIAVFSYYETPGVRFSDDERIGFFGRAS